MYSVIYANGCSYTGDNLIKDRYPELLAKQFNCDVKNNAKPGCSNRRIIRTTLVDSLLLPKDSLVLVQLTHSHRTEIATDFDRSRSWKVDSNDYFESVKPNAGDEYEQKYYRAWARTYSKSAELQNLLADVLLLSKHLASLNLDYRFFCWDDEFFELKDNFVTSQLTKLLAQDIKILSFFEFSVLSQFDTPQLYYDNSHFNDHGHFEFAEYIKEHILL